MLLSVVNHGYYQIEKLRHINFFEKSEKTTNRIFVNFPLFVLNYSRLTSLIFDINRYIASLQIDHAEVAP